MSKLPQLREDVKAEAISDEERGAFYVMKSADGSRFHELSQTAYMALSMLKGETDFESWMEQVQMVYPMVEQKHLEDLLGHMKRNDFLQEDLEGGQADPLMAATGADPLMAATGADPLMAATGADPLMAATGADPLMAATGADPLMAATGADPLMAATGADPLMAATGADPLMAATEMPEFGAPNSNLAELPMPPDLSAAVLAKFQDMPETAAAFPSMSEMQNNTDDFAELAEPPMSMDLTEPPAPPELLESLDPPAPPEFDVVPNTPRPEVTGVTQPSLAAEALSAVPAPPKMDFASDAFFTGLEESTNPAGVRLMPTVDNQQAEPTDLAVELSEEADALSLGSQEEPPEPPSLDAAFDAFQPTATDGPPPSFAAPETGGFDLGEVLDAQAQAVHAQTPTLAPFPEPAEPLSMPLADSSVASTVEAPPEEELPQMTGNPQAADAAAFESEIEPMGSAESPIPLPGSGKVPTAPGLDAVPSENTVSEAAKSGFEQVPLTNNEFFKPRPEGEMPKDAPPPLKASALQAEKNGSGLAKFVLFAAVLVIVAAGGGLLIERNTEVQFEATFTSPALIEVKSQQEGIVDKIAVAKGQEIAKEDVLFSFKESNKKDLTAERSREELKAELDFYEKLMDGKEGKRLRIAIYKAKLKAKKELKSARIKQKVVAKTLKKLEGKAAKRTEKQASLEAKEAKATKEKRKKYYQKLMMKSQKKMEKLQAQIEKSKAKIVKYADAEKEAGAQIEKLSGDLPAARLAAQKALQKSEKESLNKASMKTFIEEILAPDAGKVVSIGIEVGQKTRVGQTLIRIEKNEFKVSYVGSVLKSGQSFKCNDKVYVALKAFEKGAEVKGSAASGVQNCSTAGETQSWTMWLLSKIGG